MENLFDWWYSMSRLDRFGYYILPVLLVLFGYWLYKRFTKDIALDRMNAQESERKEAQAKSKRYKNLKVTKKGKNFFQPADKARNDKW